jgi:hypothetical protein
MRTCFSIWPTFLHCGSLVPVTRALGPARTAVEMGFSRAKLRIQVRLTAGAAHGTYNQNSTSHTCPLTHRSGSYSRYHWSFRSLLDLIRAECGQQTGSSSPTSIRQELPRQVASTWLDNWSTPHDPDLLNAFTSGEDVRYWTSLRSIPKWRSTISNSYRQGMSSPLSTTKYETHRLGSPHTSVPGGLAIFRAALHQAGTGRLNDR